MNKKSKISVYSITTFICLTLVFSLFVNLTSGDGAPEENLVRDYDGNLVNASESYLWKRTATTEIIKNPDGTMTRTIGQGTQYIDDKTRRFPFYSEFNEIFFDLINSTDPLFDYELNQYYEPGWNVYFKENPTSGQVVKYIVNETELTFQPMALNYRNDLNQLEQIKMIENVVGVPDVNRFVYPNAYGEGINLTYENKLGIMKENLIIGSFSDLPSPAQYIIDGGNVTLDLDFIISTNSKIIINGVEWNKKNKATSRGNVQIQNQEGKTLYNLPTPIITDSGGNSTIGKYEFKKAGNSLYVILKTPYEFLENAVYPVYIDPTIILQDANTENLEDSFVDEEAPDYNYGTENEMFVWTLNNNRLIGYIQFNISSLDNLIIPSILSSELFLYGSTVSLSEDLDLFEVYNDWRNSIDGTILSETQITWNNQPCGSNFDNSTYCNLTIISQQSEDENPWFYWDVLDVISRNYDNNKNNVSFAIRTEHVHPDPRDWDFWTKEYIGDTSLRPYLKITSPEYINIISPSPAQTFTEDVPTSHLNISTGVAMDTCYWTNDSGITNYTMSSVNSTYFYNNTAGNLLLDGSHTVEYYCNQSSDGTWRTSDSVSFDIDSVNVTVCRDLTVSREYIQQTNILWEGNSDVDNCINVLVENIIYNGNGNYLHGTYTGAGTTHVSIYTNKDSTTIKNTNITMYGNFAGINVQLDEAHNAKIINNTFYNGWICLFSGGASLIYGGSNNTIVENNTMKCPVDISLGGGSGKNKASNNIFRNNNLSTTSIGGGQKVLNIEDGASNNSFYNSYFDSDGTYVITQKDNSLNNLLLNVSYINTSIELVLGGSLTRKWYFSPQVNFSHNGTAVEGVNVTAYNVSGVAQESELTNADGTISSNWELVEYINKDGSKTYYTNYTINAILSGWDTDSQTINLTTNFVNQQFNISDTIPPISTAVMTSPPDGAGYTNDTWTDNDIKITITASDLGIGFDSLLYPKYCLDSINSCSPNTYISSGVTVSTEGVSYIRYNSVDNLSNAETVQSRTLKIDTINPQISILSPVNNTNSSDAGLNINYSATDTNLDSCWWTNDSGSTNTILTDCANITTVTWNEGITNLLIYTNDSVGNENHTDITFTIDITNPLVSFLTETPSDPATYSFGQSYEFNATITDTNLQTVLFEFDGTNYTPSQSGDVFNFSISDLGAGTYNYKWFANDTFGNVNNSETGSYTINQAILSASITNDRADTFTYDGTPANIGISESNTGDGDVTYILWKDDVSAGSSDVQAGAGTFNYKINSTGGTNYSSSASLDTLTLTINKAVPTGSLTSDLGWEINETQEVVIGLTESNSMDGDVTYIVYRDGVSKSTGETWSPAYGTYDYVLNTTGGTNWTLSSSMDTQTLTVNDIINPQISIIAPTNTTNTSVTTLNVTYLATDTNLYSCWWTNDSGSTNTTLTDCANITTVTWNEGITNLLIYVNDSAGNENHTDITFTIDITNPNATLISPENATYDSTTSQNFTVNFTDNLGIKNATLYIYNETGEYNQTSTNFLSGVTETALGIVVLLVDGIYNWWYTVWDWAGNSFRPSQNNTITIDTINPSISFDDTTAQDGTSQSSTSIFVNVTSSDDNNHYAFVDFDNDLVGWWRAEGDATDDSSYGNDGTLTNGASIVDGGYFGKGFSFDGNDDYISIGDVAELENMAELTISTWINFNSMTIQDKKIIGKSQSYAMFIDSDSGDNSFYVYLKTDDDAWTLFQPGIAVSRNVWHHIVMTYKTGELKLYVDGSQYGTTSTAWTGDISESINPVEIGGNYAGEFNGTIDDILMFNRTLSATEISSLYNTSANQYENNFTGLSDGTHNFTGYAVDKAGNRNDTGEWSVTVDVTAPVLSIIHPVDLASYTTNSIDLNYSVSDAIGGLDTCWYKNDTDVINVTIACGTNTSVYQASDGTYTVYMWANDTLGNEASDSHEYTISTDSPAITLINPSNNKILNTQTLWFNYTAVDSNGVDTCQLWGNWSGGWHLNDSNTHGGDLNVNSTEGNFLKTILDGFYKWNIWCNDTNPTSGFSPNNLTFLIDTVYPLIDYESETSPNNTNTTNTFIYVNISIIELNENNVTFNLNGTNYTYPSGTREINWTSQPDGVYTYYASVNDTAGNRNTTDTRTITLDDTPPNIQIYAPQTQNYGDNNTIELNYTVSDNLIGIDSCWYKVINSTGYLTISNTTITDCLNTTFGVPSGDINYNVTLYVNDSLGNLNSSSVTFGMRTESPVIVLSPTNDTYSDRLINHYFNFTVTTNADSISTCQLFGNFNGTWQLNQTLNSVLYDGSDNNFTAINLTEGSFLWNVWCNDSFNHNGWALNNLTFITDITNPEVNISSPINGSSRISSSQDIGYNISDTNLDTCYFTLKDSDGVIHNYAENSFINCSDSLRSISVLSYGTYTFYLYGEDKANQVSSDNVTFTLVSLGITPPTGGGGGASPQMATVIGIITPENFKTLSDLQRAIIYARIMELKDGGALTQEDKTNIKTNLTNENIILTLEEITILDNQINNDLIDNIEVSKSIAEKYGLLTSRIIIEESEFIVNPRTLSGATSFVCAVEGGELKKFQRPVKANKLFESCEVTQGNWDCEVSEDRLTAFITYDIKEPNFFIQTLEGEIKYISRDGDVDYTRVISLNLVNYCAEFGNTGIRVIWIAGVGAVGLSIVGFFLFKKRKLVKKRFLKLFRRTR